MTNGARIKRLRERLDRGGKQAAFAASVGISERLLRDVENKHAPLSLDKIELIAERLGVHRYEVMLPDFDCEVAPATQTMNAGQPGPVEPPPQPATLTKPFRGKQLGPRFDDESLSVRDAQELFEEAHSSRRLIAHIKTKLMSWLGTATAQDAPCEPGRRKESRQ